jgi:hypothetical protein
VGTDNGNKISTGRDFVVEQHELNIFSTLLPAHTVGWPPTSDVLVKYHNHGPLYEVQFTLVQRDSEHLALT